MAILRNILRCEFYEVTNEGIFEMQSGVAPTFATLQKMKAHIDKIFSEFSEEGWELLRDSEFGEIARMREERRIDSASDPSNRKAVKASRCGFVYVMRDTHLDAYKIGFSNNPQHRERTLQAEKPSIELLHKWQGTIADEEMLHTAFAAKRIRGEWFRLTSEDIESIRMKMEGAR